MSEKDTSALSCGSKASLLVLFIDALARDGKKARSALNAAKTACIKYTHTVPVF